MEAFTVTVCETTLNHVSLDFRLFKFCVSPLCLCSLCLCSFLLWMTKTRNTL